MKGIGQKRRAGHEVAEVDDLIEVGEINLRQLPPWDGGEDPESYAPQQDAEPRDSDTKKFKVSLQLRRYIYGVGAFSKNLILGIEGGATKTRWILCGQEHGSLVTVSEGVLGPGSLRLLSAEALRHLLSVMPSDASRVGVYLAGCATERDRDVLRDVADSVWPHATVRVGSDRESGFAAAFQDRDGIAVIAGTGSAVTGRVGGVEDRAGGWGHLLGDSGGGYDIAINALRRILYDYDTAREITPLAAETLQLLGINTLAELTTWAQAAHKSDLARITPVVFRHAGEFSVARILRRCAAALARLACSVARRLEFDPPVVRLQGGVFTGQPLYGELFEQEFRKAWPQADIDVCTIQGSLGAVYLAAGNMPLPARSAAIAEPEVARADTEQPNPRSTDLGLLPTQELVELFATEEQAVEEALRQCVPELAAAVDLVTASLQAGGRLFYIGAGTSGRLGLLDASEMPPTFGVEPEMVQGILAGGVAAVMRSSESAEDSREAGALALKDRGVRASDIVCGITASGRTPYVLGALAEAGRFGAGTILLSCNPRRDRTASHADVEIDLPTGPELITGSTRLKAGTATKVALNILSTCSMVRLGRVDGNFMSCLKPTNEKLRRRAAQIVADCAKIDFAQALDLLKCANWDIREAILRTKTCTPPEESSP